MKKRIVKAYRNPTVVHESYFKSEITLQTKNELIKEHFNLEINQKVKMEPTERFVGNLPESNEVSVVGLYAGRVWYDGPQGVWCDWSQPPVKYEEEELDEEEEFDGKEGKGCQDKEKGKEEKGAEEKEKKENEKVKEKEKEKEEEEEDRREKECQDKEKGKEEKGEEEKEKKENEKVKEKEKEKEEEEEEEESGDKKRDKEEESVDEDGVFFDLIHEFEDFYRKKSDSKKEEERSSKSTPFFLTFGIRSLQVLTKYCIFPPIFKDDLIFLRDILPLSTKKSLLDSSLVPSERDGVTLDLDRADECRFMSFANPDSEEEKENIRKSKYYLVQVDRILKEDFPSHNIKDIFRSEHV